MARQMIEARNAGTSLTVIDARSVDTAVQGAEEYVVVDFTTNATAHDVRDRIAHQDNRYITDRAAGNLTAEMRAYGRRRGLSGTSRLTHISSR